MSERVLTPDDEFDVHVVTASGSRYRVQWDGNRGVLVRTPSLTDREWSVPLRKDGEELPLFYFDKIAVDHPTMFMIQVREDANIITQRWANPTVSIEDVSVGTAE